MRKRSLPWLAIAVLPAFACAHTAALAPSLAPSTDRDQLALANTFNWIVATAPPAARYVLQVDGAPAPTRIVQNAAGLSGLAIHGSGLRDPKAGSVAIVTIRATRPVWLDPPEDVRGEMARVRIAYQLGTLAPIRCLVLLRVADLGWDLRAGLDPADATGGILTDEACWPRSGVLAQPPTSRR